MTDSHRCEICGIDMPFGRPGRPKLYCSNGCRARARSMREILAELAEPERFDGRHDWLRQRLATMTAEHERWTAASR